MIDTQLYSKKENNLVGGEAIAAGGFGCVFRPALKCKGATSRTSGVSKLLIERYAKSEYDEIRKILPIIESIPNNEDYFIAKGITMCEPDILTPSDLKNFDRKCGNLTKNGITSKNINTRRNVLGMLNTIDGGVDVRKYLVGEIDINTFNVLNENLIRLLKFGILPMNSHKLYHFDVKGNNILLGSDNKCRLIDWGLAEIQEGNRLPTGVTNKPVHFNLPFGVVMFSDEIRHIIEYARRDFISGAGAAYIPLRGIATFENIFKVKYNNQISNFLKNNGHYRYLKDTIYPIFIKVGGWRDSVGTPPPNFEDLFIDHIGKIADTYTNRGRTSLDTLSYFNDIFKHNADIWGFLMTYYDLYDSKIKELTPSNPVTGDFYKLLNVILYHGIFSLDYATERYDVNQLIEGLKGLSKILGHDIGRLTPKSPSPVPILPPTPPPAKIPTPPPALVAPIIPVAAASLCNPAKEALCSSKGKVCNPTTGRCVIAKAKAKAKAKTPTPVVVPVVVAAATPSLCEPAKIALCKSKGKVCNPKTGRCVIQKTKKVATKASSHTGLTRKMASLRHRSSSGISLGTRKRCPRGYRLDLKTKKCKKHTGGAPTFDMSRLQHLFINKDNYSELKIILDEELRKLTLNQDDDSDTLKAAINDYKQELSASLEREDDIGPNLLLLKYNTEIIGYVLGYVNIKTIFISDGNSEDEDEDDGEQIYQCYVANVYVSIPYRNKGICVEMMREYIRIIMDYYKTRGIDIQQFELLNAGGSSSCKCYNKAFNVKWEGIGIDGRKTVFGPDPRYLEFKLLKNMDCNNKRKNEGKMVFDVIK